MQSLGMGYSALPTSRQSSPTASSPGSADNMTKTNSDSSKAGKRKGTRSVSTLTPSQLARKRANDREAQRAIRARTKEHIEGLEREVEELRSAHSRDKTVQDLLRRNHALEDELRRLRESVGLPNSGSSNSSSMYASSYHNSAPTRTPSFGQSSNDYSVVTEGLPPYSAVSEQSDSWPPTTMPCSVPSTMSSPSSSGADDLSPTYFPTSAPTSMLDRSSMPPGLHSPGMNGKLGGGFEDIKSEFNVPPQVNVVPLTPSFQHQQPWNVYPTMYYPTSPAQM